MKYLVLWRGDDEPHSEVMTAKQLKGYLEDGETYNFLDNPPDYESFPSNSMFIFKGEVVIPQAKAKVTEWEF